MLPVIERRPVSRTAEPPLIAKHQLAVEGSRVDGGGARGRQHGSGDRSDRQTVAGAAAADGRARERERDQRLTSGVFIHTL